jgi:hypothetical protein
MSGSLAALSQRAYLNLIEVTLDTPFRMLVRAGVLAAIFTAGSATPARAQEQTKPAASPPAAAPAHNDYSKDDAWICRPGRQDSCAVDLDTTVITADGKMTIEKWSANPSAAIDCFYVYPTISPQATVNSDMTLEPEQKRVVRVQFARFGSQCRLYAPLYRQVTLGALRMMMTGTMTPEALEQARKLAYGDVLDAWHYYLEHDNHGRGVVLIGHSQGAGVLTHLIEEEIDGKAAQKQLISALLLGSNVPVRKGKDEEGAFQHIPLCHSAEQTGCVITYVSFRANAPPPEDSRFGTVKDPMMMVGCTNPAALGGGSGELHAYLAADDSENILQGISSNQPAWVTPAAEIHTPFVSVPGMLTAKCADDVHGSYLAVTVHDDPAEARAHNIGGDLVVNGIVLADWGLHLIDVNLAMGNLVEVVGQEAKAYLKSASKK